MSGRWHPLSEPSAILADAMNTTHSSGPAGIPERPSVPSEVWVLVAAAFCVAIGFGIVAPVLPAYAASFDVGIQAAAAIVSVFALMRLVFAPGAGALIGRLGERSVYLAGLIIVALSTGACALAEGYYQLLIFRGLGGIGSTMFTVSAAALVVRLSPPTIRGRVSSLYGAGFLVGNILGPIVGSLTAGFGYQAPFLIYAVTLLIAAAVVAVFLSGTSLRPAPGSTPLPPMPLSEALRDNAYRALLVSSFSNGWTNFGVRIALLPLFAGSTPQIGIAGVGLALAVFALGNALGLQVAGRFVDEVGRKPLLVAGLVVNGVGAAVIGLAGNTMVLLAVSVVAGLGAGVLNPSQQACVADVVGNERGGGSVVATVQMVGDAGAILGPFLAGAVATYAGFGWAFGISLPLAVIAVVAWVPARETLPRRT